MLNIHERHECGMPVIIEGETGVGKTALVEVLSKLWNSAHLNVWRKTRESVLEFIVRKMDGKCVHVHVHVPSLFYFVLMINNIPLYHLHDFHQLANND